MDDPPLSPDACAAYLLREVVVATTPPAETPSNAQARAAIIGEMFRSLAPANAMEAMIACHCIALRFVLMAATRALSAMGEEEKPRARAQASVNALSKTLHLWLKQYERVQTRAAMNPRQKPASARASRSSPAPIPEHAPVCETACGPEPCSEAGAAPEPVPETAPGPESARDRCYTVPAAPLPPSPGGTAFAPLPGGLFRERMLASTTLTHGTAAMGAALREAASTPVPPGVGTPAQGAPAQGMPVMGSPGRGLPVKPPPAAIAPPERIAMTASRGKAMPGRAMPGQVMPERTQRGQSMPVTPETMMARAHPPAGAAAGGGSPGG